jgi:hypothetical protein
MEIRKELTAGFIAFTVLIVAGFILNFHPLTYVVLSLFAAALLVSNPPIFITSKEMRERYELMECELELKNRVLVENDALRFEVDIAKKGIEFHRVYEKDLHTLNDQLVKKYDTLLKELEDLQPDKKRGLFDRQKLFKLKAEYLDQEGDLKA